MDPADLTKPEIEERLRDVIAWGRARAATQRADHPVEARAASIIVTHCEDALLRLDRPIP